MFRSVIVTVLALPVLAAGVPALAQQPPAATVRVSTVTRESMASVVLAPGTVVSRNDARVAAEIAGRLTWVAEVGEVLDAGAPIARTDDRELQLELQSNEASIRRIQANLGFLEQQLRRLERLAEQNNAARDQLDESRAGRAMTEEDLAQARVARDRTLHRLERSVVRAPFPGQIVERMRQAGEYIDVGGEIVRLVDTNDIEVRAQAPILVAPFLLEGAPITVSDDRYQVESALRTFVPVGDERSRLIEVRVSLPPGAWVIGAPVRVALPRSEPNAVVAVPRDALILREDSAYVFRVTGEGTVERIAVEPGIGKGAMVEIQGDVKPGDRVVVRGAERLRTGQPVTVPADS